MKESRTVRRRFLRALAAAGLGTVAGCGASGDGATTERTGTDATPTRAPTDRRTDDPPTDTAGGNEPEVDPEVVAGMERRAVPIGAVDPDAASGDLSAVASDLADARIIGMGEATHGTWEFQALRHRLVRTLVAEQGLQAVAFEDSFASLRPVDRYVRRGEGDLDDAMDAFGDYLFETAEVRSMVAWLRSYNEGRLAEDRVGVYGLDMQTAGGAARRVRAYLREVDQEYLDTVEERLDEAVASSNRQFDEAEVELLLAVARDLQSRLEAHRETYVDATSQRAWALALRQARVVEQTGLRGEATLRGSTPKESVLEAFVVRDRMMAENASWVSEFVDGPMAFWAHNAHVKRGRRSQGPDGELPPAQGEFLARTHGADYYPLVLTFGRGSFTARSQHGSISSPTVDEPADGTVAEVCVEVDHPQFFLDLDAATTDSALATWLDRTHGLQSVGLLWSGNTNPTEFEPRKRADGLLFVRDTTSTTVIGGDDGQDASRPRWSRPGLPSLLE